MSRRIRIVGCPGSGKSTFARRLADKTGLPLYHLDTLYWREDKTTLTRAELVERLMPILASDSWIIDGNYQGTMPLRVSYCDEVIMLDYPVDVCLEGVRARMGVQRPDMPWVETQEDPEFMDFIRAYPEEGRPAVYELMARHPEKRFTVFHNRDEAEKYLRG